LLFDAFEAMSGHQAVALDNQIFIFGGDEGAQNVYCDWTSMKGSCWGSVWFLFEN